MSNVAELHLVKQRLGQLEEVVKDIDMARPRHEEKARDKLVAEIVSNLVCYVEDTRAGTEYMDKVIGCANRWADRLVMNSARNARKVRP